MPPRPDQQAGAYSCLSACNLALMQLQLAALLVAAVEQARTAFLSATGTLSSPRPAEDLLTIALSDSSSASVDENLRLLEAVVRLQQPRLVLNSLDALMECKHMSTPTSLAAMLDLTAQLAPMTRWAPTRLWQGVATFLEAWRLIGQHRDPDDAEALRVSPSRRAA